MAQAQLNQVTISGRVSFISNDLRYSKSGIAALSLGVIHQERRFDRAKNEWIDGETFSYNVTVWGKLAENAHATLQKGVSVVIVGRSVGLDTYDKEKPRLRVTAEQVLVPLDHQILSFTDTKAYENRQGSNQGYTPSESQRSPQGAPASSAPSSDDEPF